MMTLRREEKKVLREIMWMLVGAGSIVTGIVLIYLLAAGNSFLNVLSFCVVLLIASIPIAMRVVCVTTLAIGCGELSPVERAARERMRLAGLVASRMEGRRLRAGSACRQHGG